MRAVTSDGLEVDLRYYPDIRGEVQEARAVYHLIEASVVGEPAGYLRIAWLSEQKFQEWFSTPFDYAILESGSYRRIHTLLREKRQDRWSKADLQTAIEDSYGLMHPEEVTRLAELDEAELRERWAARQRSISNQYQKRWQEFKEFTLDKPVVDFVRVYSDSMGDQRRYSGGQEQDFPDGQDWRRHGIGTVLYEAAALQLAEQGLCLWTAGTQSKAAQLSWKRLDEKHGLEQAEGQGEKGRRYLDGNQIDLARPTAPRLSQLAAAAEPISSPATDELRSPQIPSLGF